MLKIFDVAWREETRRKNEIQRRYGNARGEIDDGVGVVGRLLWVWGLGALLGLISNLIRSTVDYGARDRNLIFRKLKPSSLSICANLELKSQGTSGLSERNSRGLSRKNNDCPYSISALAPME
jgi:hypothetical protein